MKKSIALIFTIVLIVGLAACSNNKNDKKDKTTDDGEMKVGELMQEDKTRIWYVLSNPQTNELKEESEIDRFIVTKNGKMKVYMSGGIKLKHVADENQKTLLKDLEDFDNADHLFKKEEYVSKTKNAIKGTKAYINSDAEDDEKWGEEFDGENNSFVQYAEAQDKENGISPKKTLKDQKEYLKKLESTEYKKPKSKEVNLHVNEDGTETINVARNYGFPKASGSVGDSTDDDSEYTFNQGYQPVPFGENDNTFAGLSFKEENEDFNDQSPYLITKVSQDIQTVLKDESDDPSIKGNKTKND